MSTLARRERSGELAGRFGWMDRLFEEWLRSLPMRRPFGLNWDWPGEDLIRLDEFREGNTQVIRAELPGIDPDKDVEITVVDGTLQINAERRVEEKSQDAGYTRQEMRYGSFTRTLPLAEDATEGDIKAGYKDGILEIRVPVAERAPASEPTKIAVSKG